MKPNLSLKVATCLIAVAAFLAWNEMQRGVKEATSPESESAEMPQASLRVINRSELPLSRVELRQRFPAKLPNGGLLGAMSYQDSQLKVFRQFGALEGEAAVDEIFQHYGKKRSVGFAMTLAIAGWMEHDFDGALEAFHKLIQADQSSIDNDEIALGAVFPQRRVNALTAMAYQWKGESFQNKFG